MAQDKQVKVIENQYHKKYWDYEPGKVYINTIGLQSDHIDKKMGMSFEDIESLSMRDQREIIKKRFREINKIQN